MALIIRFWKTVSFSVILLVQFVSSAQGTWEKINVPTNQYLKSVCFTDSLYGWVAGDSGTILHTIDEGVTWDIQDSHGYNEISDVFFLNRNLGWASSLNYTTPPFGTVLLKTTNGGVDWVGYPYPTENIFISCILFRDSLNGWMGGSPHALVNTKNGGIDWKQAEIDTSVLAFFPVLTIQFYNEKYGYASGGMFDIAGVIWRTSNGGEKWYAIDPLEAPADEVHGLHLFDSINVMGAGGDPDFGYGVGMTRTSDGGLHWNYEELDIQGTARDIDFRNDTEVWAPLGVRQLFIYSLDAGATWNSIPTPDSAAIFDVVFPDSLHGFAVGREGALLKYKPRIIPSVNPVPDLADDFTLLQNYPNPFTCFTKMKYSLPSKGKYHQFSSGQSDAYPVIKVYNLLGYETATIKPGGLSPGLHELEFDAAGLPAGIYIYQLHLVLTGKSFPVTQPKKLIIRR
jgi:photosystem II stability/assembly factor-like uncharacterized protein